MRVSSETVDGARVVALSREQGAVTPVLVPLVARLAELPEPVHAWRDGQGIVYLVSGGDGSRR